MTAAADCGSVRVLLGTYVLGGLLPAERTTLDAHLRGCLGCREELAGLAVLPGLLARISAEQAEAEVDAAPPSADLLERLLAAVAADRRAQRSRHRLHLLSAAAAVVVALVGVGVVAPQLAGLGGLSPARTPLPPASGSPTPGSPTPGSPAPGGPTPGSPGPGGPTPGAAPARTVSAADPASGIRASVAVTPRGWGSALRLSLSGVPGGERCQLIAVAGDGRRETTASWQATYAGVATVDGATALPAEQINAFEVSRFDGTRLLAIPGG